MATLVGKVGIVIKGNWSSSATYEALDAVYYQNGTYIAKQAVPANTLPTNTTYWQVGLDAAGITTPTIIDTETKEIISSDVNYGNVVFRKYSNGVKSVTCAASSVPSTALSQIVTASSQFAPSINCYFAGASAHDKFRGYLLGTNSKLTIYAQTDGDTGAYFTYYYV